MAFGNGYNMAQAFNLDGLGWLYISIATIWTTILLIGITFLTSRRDLPFLRIRNIPLAVSAVATLHVYWVLCLIAYVLQGFFPCATEFWIMSIYLPLGIALFQACNTQLLHIAGLQKRYTTDTIAEPPTSLKGTRVWKKYWIYLFAENPVKRTMAFIGYGMIFQFITTAIIFLLSRKFHSGFGLVASSFSKDIGEGDEVCAEMKLQYHVTTCDAAKKVACRRGWEWIPSIAWQFFWSWCYAPYLLWQLRHVRDVHGWRKQTTLCCLAGLVATPMWLCALYIPNMYVVNRFYVPPLWFVPSIFIIEACLVFVPCWQVIQNHRLHNETLNIIADWECKNSGSSIGTDKTQLSGRASNKPSTMRTTSSRRGDMYTMAALESAIRTNPQPLQLFAALKDFSGENISFLTKVLEWKRAWSCGTPTKTGFLRRPSLHDVTDQAFQQQQFRKATEIYTQCVSLRHSDYPINLSHAHLKELEAIFEIVANNLSSSAAGECNNATPFDHLWHSTSNEDVENAASRDAISINSAQHQRANDSTDCIIEASNNIKHRSAVQTYEMHPVGDQLQGAISIPEVFGPDIFDRAEDSIKYMVLTNTWPKFVNAGYANIKKKTFLQEMRGKYVDCFAAPLSA